MLFNSFHFVVFFPVVTLLYFATPHRARWALLLAASYYFYGAWRIEYLALLALCTSIDYVAALRIEAASTPGRRKAWLLASLASNLGMLGFFKYGAFLADSAVTVLGTLGVVLRPAELDLLLPVGISFYTFQTIAYTVDVYRGQIRAERHLGRFALYVSFFPQLVAGPIERPSRLLPQFDRHVGLDGRRIVSGLTRMAWGFFQKLVIADRLAVYVDQVYGAGGDLTAGTVLLAAYFFYFQLYADFAGYCDIAIGSARVLGIDLMENFRRPFLATSMADVWRRWHISLMNWFRDYLYAVLPKGRVGSARWIVAILIVFLASGLWHGAAWTFVVFGGIHGLLLVVGGLTARARRRAWGRAVAIAARGGPHAAAAVAVARTGTGWFVTFHLSVLSMIFFRAESVAQALAMFRALLTGAGAALRPVTFDAYELAIAATSLAVLVLVPLAGRLVGGEGGLARRGVALRWLAFYSVSLATLMFGRFGVDPFYYFQF